MLKKMRVLLIKLFSCSIWSNPGFPNFPRAMPIRVTALQKKIHGLVATRIPTMEKYFILEGLHR